MVKDIILKTLGVTYSLKKYVDPVSISYLRTMVDGEFETGTINIEGIKPDEFETLDMSRPIPTNSIVEIILDNDEVIQTYIAEDLVSPIMMNRKLYSHEIQLVEPVKILTRINTPAFTITQPKSAGFITTSDIFAGSLDIGLDEVFSGEADDFLQFGHGTNSATYNLMNQYNSIRNINLTEKGNGIVIGENETVKVLNFGSIPTIPVTDKNKFIDLELDFVNPQYNLFREQRYENIPGIVAERTYFAFQNADMHFDIVVKLGVEEIYRKRYNLPGNYIMNPTPNRVNLISMKVHGFNEGQVEEGTLWGTLTAGVGTGSIWKFQRTENLQLNKKPTAISKYAVDINPEILSVKIPLNIDKSKTGDLTIEVVKDSSPWEMKFSTTGDKLEVQTTRGKKLLISGGAIHISTCEGETKDYKPLDKEIENILSLNDRHNIILDPDTKHRVSNILSPELTYDSNNMYEVLKDIGLYLGAIPKLRLKSENVRIWVPATEAEYLSGPNKILIESSNIIEVLNKVHKNKDETYVAKMDPPYGVDYDFIPSTVNEYNSASHRLNLSEDLGSPPTLDDLWSVYIANVESYQMVVPLMYNNNTIIRLFDGENYTYWKLEKLEELTTLYAKTNETNIVKSIKHFYYDFYDDLEKERINKLSNTTVEVRGRNVEDYVSSIELNVDNLVSEEETINTGWLKITGTTGDIHEKINSDNIGIRLPNGPIYEIKRVLLQLNMDIVMEDNSVVDGEDIIDITDLVIEEAFYNTLQNKSEYSIRERKYENTKNQVLYYRQGDDMIYNMGFTGTHPPIHEMTGPKSTNRAIYEIAAKKAVLNTGLQTKKINNHGIGIIDPGDLADDFNIRLLFEYIPMTSTRVNIYKDDQSGFLEDTSKYYNEQQKFNDTALLGRTAQGKINRMGNTEIERDGSTTNINFIPNLGTFDEPNGRLLTKINQIFLPNRIDYTTTHVKDYSTINEYFGIPSAYRQYEIPRENIVDRVDKKEIHTYVGFEPYDNHVRFGLNTDVLFSHLDLFNREMKTPQFARVKTYDDKGLLRTRVIKSINTKVIGKNITHTFNMLDNYSAGKHIVKKQEFDEDKYFQQDIVYVDNFGNVEKVEIDMLHTNDLNNITNQLLVDFTEYPIWDKDKEPEDYDFEYISTYNHIINKDTREAYSFSQDIRYFSSDDKIIIFPGMAKYNTLGNIDNATIRIGILTKHISRSTFNLSRRDIISIPHDIMFEESTPYYWDLNSSYLDFKIQLGFDDLSYCGIIIYEYNSMEPLMLINMSDEYEENSEYLEGTIYFGIDDFEDVYISPDYAKTLSPIILGVGSTKVGPDEWNLIVKIKNNDGSPADITINGYKVERFQTGEIKSINYRTVYYDPYESIENITVVASVDGKILSDMVIENHEVEDLDAPPTTKYTVTFKRGWDNSVIKTQQVTRRGNATFPTNIEINYGISYEYSYHTGNYINVMEDEVVTIYRKFMAQKWVRKSEVVNFLPPTTPGAAPGQGESCSIIGQRYDTGIGVNMGDDQYHHIYFICEGTLI